MLLPFVAHAQEVREVEREVKVYFRQDATAFDGGYRNNNSAFSEFANEVRSYWQDTTAHLRHVRIVSSVSPEGSIAVNDRTAKRRANTIVNRMRGVLDTTVHFDVVIMGADWERLDQLVAESEALPHREDVITLLETTSKSERLNALRELHEEVPYEWMFENLFPELRYVEVSCVFYWEPTPEPEPTPAPKQCAEEVVEVEESEAPIEECAEEQIETPVVESTTEEVAEEVESVDTPVATPLEAVTPKSKSPVYWSLKTNLLYDLFIVPNIGVEVYLGENISAVANYHGSWWKSDRKTWYWMNYGGDIALRYWFGGNSRIKPLTGHHAGIYGQIITYDFLIGNSGTLAKRGNWSVGAEYGYSMPLTRRLNLDFTLGVGYHWGIFDEYIAVDGHYSWQATKRRKYFGPTKLEVSLVWLLGAENYNKKGAKR